MMRKSAVICFLIAICLTSGPALAQVDIKTPWANVYVGKGGVFVHGPWGRVDVPVSERARVCAKWRESTQEYYDEKGCEVEYDDDGCIIDELSCPE